MKDVPYSRPADSTDHENIRQHIQRMKELGKPERIIRKLEKRAAEMHRTGIFILR